MSRAELQESSISRISSHYSKHPLIIMRDGPFENLWGEGEQAGARENYMKKKKIQARQLILKMFMLWPKKKN